MFDLPLLKIKSNSIVVPSGCPSASLHRNPSNVSLTTPTPTVLAATNAVSWSGADAELTRPRHPRSPLSVAGMGARIGERLPGDGNEPPVETRRVQSQLEHAEGVGVADEAIRGDRAAEGEMAVPARARDDLNNASGRVQVTTDVLRRKALVIVWAWPFTIRSALAL
jgi:hypothetical protein